MKLTPLLLLRGASWTVGAFGFAQALRLIANVLLARLLAPELFGLMQIVSGVQTGIELISDVGIGQNLIYNKSAEDPDFYNTAWTLQIIRGVTLSLVFCAAAFPIATFYRTPILGYVIPISAIGILLGSFASTSRFILQKRMLFGRIAVFESIVAIVYLGSQLILAYLDPTIWSLVWGGLIGTGVFALGSHFLLPQAGHRLVISRRYAATIISFGKWIFASSLVYFLSSNYDRLYLAKAIPLNLLGIYGIARTFSGLFSTVVQQLGNVIFPYVASHANLPRAALWAQLAGTRMKFLLAMAFGLSLFAASADLLVRALYDQRYYAATWMLPILSIGAWFSILCNIGESTLLGLGKPSYNTFSNGAKFIFLFLGLALLVPRFGVVGGIMVIALSDLFRYVPIVIGLHRERLSVGRQDLATTTSMLVLFILWESLRWMFGRTTPFDALHVGNAI